MMRLLLIPVVAVLAAGCGDSKPSATVSESATPATPAVTTTTPASSSEGVLFNMATLEDAVVQGYNSTPPYRAQVASADCRLISHTIARCVLIGVQGGTSIERVTISQDGTVWRMVPWSRR